MNSDIVLGMLLMTGSFLLGVIAVIGIVVIFGIMPMLQQNKALKKKIAAVPASTEAVKEVVKHYRDNIGDGTLN